MAEADEPQKTHHEELPAKHDDAFISLLHKSIRLNVRVLALMMSLVVLWGTIDLAIDLYEKWISPPILLITMPEILGTFAGFLTILIAIEIFSNITLYIRNDVFPIQLVVATALMAISRKIIVLDFEKVSAMEILATAAVVLALGITYWLLDKKTPANGITQR